MRRVIHPPSCPVKPRERISPKCRGRKVPRFFFFNQCRQIAKLKDQAVGLAQRIRGLVNENARTQMTEEEFTPEYDRLVSQYEKLAAKIAAIQREKEGKEYRAKRIPLFMRMLARQEECLEFDPAVFTAFVEKVVVGGTKKDVRLVYMLRNGLEYRIDGVR